MSVKKLKVGYLKTVGYTTYVCVYSKAVEACNKCVASKDYVLCQALTGDLLCGSVYFTEVKDGI